MTRQGGSLLAAVLGLKVVIDPYIPDDTMIFLGRDTVLIRGVSTDGDWTYQGWLEIYRRWA